MKGVASNIRVERASRVLVSVSHRNDLLLRDGVAQKKSATCASVRSRQARETRTLPRLSAFTVIELLIVMSIIIVLAGLILATSGYVQKKGARSRAEAEIAAMSAALESYKADNGAYATDTTKTEGLNPASATQAEYKTSSTFIYGELTGDRDLNGTADSAGSKSYMSFKPAMLQRNLMSSDVSASNPVIAIRDPFGNSYGYSTMKAANPAAAGGHNPTFDLWSIADDRVGGNQAKWIKNW